MSNWHRMEAAAVLAQLDTELSSGLTDTEATARRGRVGENELVSIGRRKAWNILWDQLRGALVVLLVVAAIVSVYLEEYIDAGAVLAIVILNAILGFVQEYRAENALAALKKLAVPTVRVRRAGRLLEISARELVPGDLVALEAGNYVPADCRILESANLKIEEAALTGESEPVVKSVGPISDDGPLGDHVNMAFMGTLVTYGHALAAVTETGMHTELGRIAHSLQTVEAELTPLQRRLAQLGRTLAFVALLIVGIVFLMGLLRGEDPKLMMMTSLSLAVAIVPEGLPAVATVALALGARRMFRHKALIRRLPAVETLGSVTVICSDKTGTLTENRMTVTALDVADERVDLAGGQGAAEESTGAHHPALAVMLVGGALCNDAELECDGEHDEYRVVGDPTEGAMAVVAARMGFVKSELERLLPRVDELPFDSDRKRMTTVHSVDSATTVSERLRDVLDAVGQLGELRQLVFTKGAVDQVLEVSRFVWTPDNCQSELDEQWMARIRKANDQLASDGMRVLGVAIRAVDAAVVGAELEQDLVFVGLLGMIDPPRKEAKEAVSKCRRAGIRPVMITGDHPLTALHIARQLGVSQGEDALTGRELSEMTMEELEQKVEEVSVYARVAPKDKLHIVQALQERGHIVAMTGDGVNDAPALKQAHIGVAMGITGTDVSKEASEMVLLDDNFATIVDAIEEGRTVYDNIRKFVKYTMTSNAGEICVMVIGPLVGMPLPLLPLQILWINLVTDGLPGLALSVEPAERNTMDRPPLRPDEPIFGKRMIIDIAWIGILMGVVSLALGFFYWVTEAATEAHWRTIVFTVLTLSQMGNALAIRSSRQSLFQVGLLSNKAMLGSVLLTFLMQMAVIYLPPMQSIFKTTALSALELLVCLALSSVVFVAVELGKSWRK